MKVQDKAPGSTGGHRTGQLGWEQWQSWAGTWSIPCSWGHPDVGQQQEPPQGLSPRGWQQLDGLLALESPPGHLQVSLRSQLPLRALGTPNQPAQGPSSTSGAATLWDGFQATQPQQEPRSEELGKGHPNPTPVPSQLPPQGAKGIPERFFHQLRNPLGGKHG